MMEAGPVVHGSGLLDAVGAAVHVPSSGHAPDGHLEPLHPDPTAHHATADHAAAHHATADPSTSNDSHNPPAASHAPNQGPSQDPVQAAGYDRITGPEIARVLSHYDIGTIDKVARYLRGSRKAPKLRINATVGGQTRRYLLKRRAQGRHHPDHVAFCQEVQLHLAGFEFPLPALIGTREDNNSMLQLDGHIYELFEYVPGDPYDQSVSATRDAGLHLGRFHRILGTFHSHFEPPRGSYHAARSVLRALRALPEAASRMMAGPPASTGNPGTPGEPGEPGEPGTPGAHDALAWTVDRLRTLIEAVQETYADAAEAVEARGYADLPRGVVHSDWHPGNMRFTAASDGEQASGHAGQRVAAVLDYDAARIQPRVIDIANGVLQFSMLGGGDNADHWPDRLDGARLSAFLAGYATQAPTPLSDDESAMLVPLMIEALVAEAVVPIVHEGAFGPMHGLPFLAMVQRKTAWLHQHRDELTARLREAQA